MPANSRRADNEDSLVVPDIDFCLPDRLESFPGRSRVPIGHSDEGEAIGVQVRRPLKPGDVVVALLDFGIRHMRQLFPAVAGNSSDDIKVQHGTLRIRDSLSDFLGECRDIPRLPIPSGQYLHVYGSANLLQTLLKHDLVDAFWLKIFPITLGGGKRLFAEGRIPAAFKVTESTVTSKGVMIVNYDRAGAVPTGSL
jgi:hypothetical protein